MMIPRLFFALLALLVIPQQAFSYEANGHLTTVAVPANAPDSRNTVFGLDYDAPVVIDPANIEPGDAVNSTN